MKTRNELAEKYVEMNEFENIARNKGKKVIVGIDEVGRGPLAGPMVIAGVILNQKNEILGLDDSKKLSKAKRKDLSKQIKEKSTSYQVSFITAKEIDEKGLSFCLNKAVNKIINYLSAEYEADYALLDFMKVEISLAHEIIKKGDQKSNSIAAASIIAKVARDNYMHDLATLYPEYKFETNVGYGTQEHVEAIKKYGIIKNVHRSTFEPIKSGKFKERYNEKFLF